MKIYIVRHGQDDNTVRGGWSDGSLTELGIVQANTLAEDLKLNQSQYNIKKIISSDLKRALQTAQIIADSLNLEIETDSNLREVNNGDLAGMKNEIADKLYPNLYWRNLEWNQNYPNGESPCEFYNRVYSYFSEFIKENRDYDKNILIITHGGVINIIRSIINNEQYSNKNKFPSIPCCSIEFIVEV